MRRLLVLLLAVVLLGGCGDDGDAYCDAVAERQEELSEIVGGGSPDALIQALDIFRELQDEAPSDISDEWQQVVSSVEGLEQALDDAGVDPATYDPESPPAGLGEAEQQEIAAAASRLGSAETAQALQALDQQARDVCKTPLTL
ncbi:MULTISPECIES: hypothetical protein [unclassified Nocardioides]|uniref:hypothetical protein n=1 Tax=unclassified Nocardioides TaxID=2615069 RepID=UPI00361A8E9C